MKMRREVLLSSMMMMEIIMKNLKLKMRVRRGFKAKLGCSLLKRLLSKLPILMKKNKLTLK